MCNRVTDKVAVRIPLLNILNLMFDIAFYKLNDLWPLLKSLNHNFSWQKIQDNNSIPLIIIL